MKLIYKAPELEIFDVELSQIIAGTTREASMTNPDGTETKTPIDDDDDDADDSGTFSKESFEGWNEWE